MIFSIQEWIRRTTDSESLEQFRTVLEARNSNSLQQLLQGDAYQAICKMANEQGQSHGNQDKLQELISAKQQILSSFRAITNQSSFFINLLGDGGSNTLFEFVPGSEWLVKHTADFKISEGTSIV